MIGLVLCFLKFMVYYGFSPGIIFSYLSTGQERLRYDLYCVEWDVKPQLNQSVCGANVCLSNQMVACCYRSNIMHKLTHLLHVICCVLSWAPKLDEFVVKGVVGVVCDAPLPYTVCEGRVCLLLTWRLRRS